MQFFFLEALLKVILVKKKKVIKQCRATPFLARAKPGTVVRWPAHLCTSFSGQLLATRATAHRTVGTP